MPKKRHWWLKSHWHSRLRLRQPDLQQMLFDLLLLLTKLLILNRLKRLHLFRLLQRRSY